MIYPKLRRDMATRVVFILSIFDAAFLSTFGCRKWDNVTIGSFESGLTWCKVTEAIQQAHHIGSAWLFSFTGTFMNLGL